METPHFEIYTDRPNTVAPVLNQLEPLRAFFEFAIHSGTTLRKTRLVILNDKKRYVAFRPKQAGSAWFPNLPHRDLLVAGPVRSSVELSDLKHQYIHLLVRQTGMRIPVWLNEGLAEVYESLQPVDGGVQLPAPSNADVRRLDHSLDLKKVFLAESYGEERHEGTFPDQCWVLTHMLLMEQDLRDRFASFIKVLQQGMSNEEAIHRVYGMSAQQLETHVRGYLRLEDLNGMRFPLHWDSPEPGDLGAPATPFESALLMADLNLAAGNWTAAARYAETARAAEPGRPELEETLTVIRKRDGSLPELAEAQNEPAPPGTSVVGRLTEVECANGKIILHLITSEGVRRFPVDPARALEKIGGPANIGCGKPRRARQVRLGITPDGLVRKLEYQ